MSLINCEINLILTCSENFIISFATGATKLAITHTKFYVSVKNLSANDNTKPLQQLKSDFKRTKNRSKYQSKESLERQNQYLDYLVDLSFQEVNRLFVLSFEDSAHRIEHR